VKDRSTWNALVLAARIAGEPGGGAIIGLASGHMEPTQAFDLYDLAFIEQQSATSADGRDLVRIEGVAQGPSSASCPLRAPSGE
jgi:hypothetical protein